MIEKEDSSIVTITNPQHNKLLIEGLYNLLLEEHDTDIELRYGGKSVGVHRIVMDIFLPPEGVKRKASGCHRRDTQHSLGRLLEFMYVGRLAVPKDQLDDLLKVAKQLKFRKLVDAIESVRQIYEAVPASIHFEISKDPSIAELKDTEGWLPVLDASQLLGFGEESLKGSNKDNEVGRLHQEVLEGESRKINGEGDEPCSDSEDEDMGGAYEQQCSSESKDVHLLENEKDQAGDCVLTNVEVVDPARDLQDINDGVAAFLHCPYCKNDLPSSMEYNLHLSECHQYNLPSQATSTEEGERRTRPLPVYSKCPHCSFHAFKERSMNTHLRTVHCLDALGRPVSKELKCPDCDFSHLYRSVLNRHLETKHLRCPKFTKFTFYNKRKLDLHLSLAHSVILKDKSSQQRLSRRNNAPSVSGHA